MKITFVSHPHESLEIVVEDTGTGPNKYTAAQIVELLAKQKQLVQNQYLGLRGRGLAKIVSEWTDELIFEDLPEGGLRVRVKKYLKPESNLPPSPTNAPSASIPLAV